MGNVHLEAVIRDREFGGRPMIRLVCDGPQKAWMLVPIGTHVVGLGLWEKTGDVTKRDKAQVLKFLEKAGLLSYSEEVLAALDAFNTF